MVKQITCDFCNNEATTINDYHYCGSCWNRKRMIEVLKDKLNG